MDDRFVLQVGDECLKVEVDNPAGTVAIEDLLPVNIAVDAAARYCREFVPLVNVHDFGLDTGAVFAGAAPGRKGLLNDLETAIGAKVDISDFHLDKIAFARCVVEILMGDDDSTTSRVTTPADLDLAKSNLVALLSNLARLQRDAVRAGNVDRISSRINRIKREFTRTQKGVARREDVLDLIEQIEAQLDYSVEADAVRETLAQWRPRFKLTEDPREEIADYDDLSNAITSLAYQAVRSSEKAQA